MAVTAIVGAQWGDEGKGKVVDLLAESADMVVRYAGGPNAGHTLVVGEERMVFRLVPSGVLHGHTQCVLAQGMVINPAVLIEEIDTLTGKDFELDGRLHLSDRAHLILPYHVDLDGLREASKSATKIGTTKRGIGPCYEDKVGRRGVRTGDLRDLSVARERIAEAIAQWAPTIAALGGDVPSVDAICEPLAEVATRLVPLLTDTAALVDEAVSADKRVMLEGAQGTMLDIDHGTYPYVTSSSAIAGGACTGAGIGPSRVGKVLGISKAYTTRVGEGPFPTQLDDDIGQQLRDVGGEYGSVTGRPRRTGWLDLAALRYAARVNGLDALAVTKLDVMSDIAGLKVCMRYDDAGRPVYETLPGWTDKLSECRSLEALPANARTYLQFIEDQLKVPIDIVSVGARRDETIVVRDAMLSS